VVGTTISHYKVIEKIGQGGMGEVFLAQDTTLDRKVALKFLPEELQLDPTARKRFLREAKSAAALDHPFICKIYEIGEAQGRIFIAMEYVQGMTLEEKLAEGPLPARDVLETAREIADALEGAHKRGIVHRDLKPSNIMLIPEGHVKVMDFGLAKRVTPGGSENDDTTVLTKEGAAVGTVPYMSPEQIRGQRLDTRSDIFSFGVLLYEMVTGVNPFQKSSTMDTAQTILSENPPPITRYADDAPDFLQHTVRKMLAKEPDQRYQLIHDVRTDLGELSVTSGDSEVSAEVAATTPAKRSYLWPAVAGGVMVLVILALALSGPFTATPEEAIDSIAVLPFENASNDPEMEYLSDGIAGSIVDSLTRLKSLRVMPTSSVARYKGQDISPGTVAEDLGIRAVLTGTVVQRGDDLSLRVELVDTVEDRLLWGEQYNRKFTETLALQEEIAREISEKLRLEITGEEERQLSKRGTQNPEAYDAYLKGRYYWNNQKTPDGLEKAMEHFDQAIGLDPNYAQAYAGLAETYYLQAMFGIRTVEDVYELEMSAAQKALQLDADLAEAHVAMASIKGMHDWDWSTAETEYKRAIELNPNSVRAHHGYSYFLQIHRRFDEALAEAKKARELDPLALQVNSSIGEILLHKREYDEAIEQLKETLEIDPSYPLANAWLVEAYRANGEREQAMAHVEKWQPDSPPRFFPWPYMALVRHTLSGNRVEAIRILESATEIWPQVEARAYMRLGETDRAIEVVTSAIDEGDLSIAVVNFWPEFDPLREDPRFQEQLRRMDLEP
jgi:TolB-like protein/predicted Ser/Thr protein kinase